MELVEIHFPNSIFQKSRQINRGTVVNMKVHTDPKNSYMHPFVWQSITVRKFFYSGKTFFPSDTYIGSLAPANFTGAVQKRP